ncbi:conjugal transfer protein TrbL family protein [Actinoplanes sp. NPDC051475]|uniref:conjugal transfer protein TrbL family protein n=1 Tax=Actinoplanes sp. NPDC051475 TaxID=3157225 RepID=UPI00344B9948
MGFVMDQIVAWLLKFIVDSFTTILQIIETGLLHTPDVTTLPQVRALSDRSVWVVDVAFVLVFTAAAAITMTSGSNERARYEVKDLIPRAVVGFIAAHFSPVVISQTIAVTNALVGAFSSEQLDDSGALDAISRQVRAAGTEPSSPLLAVLLVAVIAVLLASTAFGLLTRIAILLVLATVAPIALALHALPQTDGIARLWWQTLLGCLVTPALQAFCLQAGTWMLLDPSHTVPFGGAAAGPVSLINLLVVIMLLYVTVKVPKLVKQYLVRGAPPHNLAAAVVRTVVVNQGARAVGIPARLVGGGR